MLKKIINPKSSFARFFMEADGDDNEDQVNINIAPKQPASTDYDNDESNLNIKPRMGGNDYTADAEDDTPEETANTENDNPPTDNADDNTAGETPENNGEDTADGEDDTADDDTAADDGGGDEEGTEDDDTATDYTADDTGDGTDNAGETDDGNDTANQPDENNGGDDEKLGEQRKKYVMYTRFLKLHNAIDGFISKLHGIVKNDVTENTVIKVVSNNLIDLKNNLYEYMTVKYKSASYVEIHIFYETAISCVKLNFAMLTTNNINIQNN